MVYTQKKNNPVCHLSKKKNNSCIKDYLLLINLVYYLFFHSKANLKNMIKIVAKVIKKNIKKNVLSKTNATNFHSFAIFVSCSLYSIFVRVSRK